MNFHVNIKNYYTAIENVFMMREIVCNTNWMVGSGRRDKIKNDKEDVYFL